MSLAHVPLLGRFWRARAHILALQQEVASLRARMADLERAGAAPQLPAAPSIATAPLTLDPRDVPIFINSFNRVVCLRRLIGWLQAHGHRRIIVIDNASTYPPLLAYYAGIETQGVTVLRLGENVGSRALWDRDLLRAAGVASEFVYTDPDIVPAASCPGDVIAHFQAQLNTHPDVEKIGLGLLVDRIPPHFRHRDAVLHWEAQFWRRPAARGLMFAQVDTTFALYRPGAPHAQSNRNLRTTYPYLGEHLGWYEDSANPSEEDRFYRATARTDVTNWNGTELGPVAPLLADLPALRLMHLGCGHDVFPGWLNVDLRAADGVRAVDLDAVGDGFADLPNDSFDGFYGCHLFEHLGNSLALMQELHRLARPGARMILRVPYGASNDADEDPTHRHRLFEGSFVYYAQPAYSRADYGYRGDWEVERVKLALRPEALALPRDLRQREVARARNAVQEMIVHLRAVKPVRPCDVALLRWPVPDLVGSTLDFDSGFERTP